MIDYGHCTPLTIIDPYILPALAHYMATVLDYLRGVPYTEVFPVLIVYTPLVAPLIVSATIILYPKTILYTYSHSWLVNNLSHEAVVAVLSKPLNGEGMYLVRRDEDPESDNLVLYVKHNNNVVQYTINSTNGYFSVDIPEEDVLYQHIFSTAEELLLHYSEKREDICTKLEKPCLYSSEWEIKADEIESVTSVPSSGHVEVWKGQCGKHTIQGKRLKSVAQPHEACIEEVEVMKRLNHQNIVKFHGVVIERVSITIITEYIDWKTLAQHYAHNNVTSVSVHMAMSILRQVLNGLAHMQSNTIVHLNFGARSVLFVEEPRLLCKITDFSVAQRIDVDSKAPEMEKLRIRWLPPEVFEGKQVHENCDVWSFGIFIHELFTACGSPYPTMSDGEVVSQVKAGYCYRTVRPTSCPQQLYAVARECWNLTPDRRPSFKMLQLQLMSTITMEGWSLPAPRTDLQKQVVRPVPKPRKMAPQTHENTTILSSPNCENQGKVSEGGHKPPDEQWTESVVPLLPSLPPPPRRSQNSELQIKRKDVKLVSKIRNRLDDEVWEGVWKGNRHVLVILQQAEMPEQIEIMKKLKNDYVVQLLGICTLQTPVYLVTEIMRPGSLLTFLRSNKGALEDQVLLQMAIEISKGMTYLHSHFFIHRDLRADTILLDENNTCKIAQFNYVKKVDEDTHTYTAAGTERIAVKWAPPEALLQGIFSTRSDVWSFGIMLYEIVTYGSMPYSGMTNVDTVKRVAEGYRMPRPDSTYCPEEVYKIMLKCWDKKPDERPSSLILPQMLRDLTEPEDDEALLYDEESDNEVYIRVYDYNDIVPNTNWNIDYSDLIFANQRAQGASGTIWEGKLKEDVSVAIKCIDVTSLEGETQQRVEVMKQLEHSNVLELHGVCSAKNSMCIVTELMNQGNLCEYLQRNSRTLVTHNLVSFSWQISNGMAYLEGKGIIHGNLTAAKVLVREETEDRVLCKISGMFGTEQDMASVGLSVRIPPKWMAPETAIERVYHQQSDIWAFGVVLYEIMTRGQTPFPEMTNEEVLDNVIRGYRMPSPVYCREDMYMLMQECWNEDPSRRPAFEDIATTLGDIKADEEATDNELYLYEDLPFESDDSFEEENDVNLKLKVAEPASGAIWRGTWNGIRVAIKYPRAGSSTEETLKSFELVKKLKHTNILQVFELFTRNHLTYVVMEFMCRGNLQDFIAWEGSFLTQEKQIDIAVQCARGMSYLESQDIVHGNLTARSVLVGDNLSCKITGIMGKSIENEDPYSGNKTFYVPYKWMAVETLLYEEFSIESDTWSFGILLYEILTHGSVPYPQWSSGEAVSRVQEGYRMPCPPDCPNEVYSLMKDCWSKNPSDRPPFSMIERKLEDILAYDAVPVEEEWPWNIKASNLSRGPKIADSETGEIYSGILQGKVEVAIVCPTQAEIAVAELIVAELMKPLKHPQILRVLGVCTVDDSVWICTEMMANGNLKKYIQREHKALSVQQLVQFSAQCASGMMYLEERDLIHGNLTACQVLVGEDLNCKITGISGGGGAPEDPYSGAVRYFLPVKWRAPETIKYHKFTAATDVWSFGILLYEIMSYGRDPYSGMSNSTASEEIANGCHVDCPPNSPRQVKSLLLDCLAEHQDARPKFDHITLRLRNALKFMAECESDEPAPAEGSLEVRRSDVFFEDKISSGKSGDIWKGVLKGTKAVAIQIVDEKDEEWIKLMMKLNHPNILGIEALCCTLEETLIITELMENDNLVTYLRSGGRSLKLQQLMHIALQISHGMVYLKSQNVVHRDLCARNVLVGEKRSCKITGILGDWVDDPYYNGREYTPPVKWAAPEAALFGNFTFQSDVWSLGVVLYEIVTYGRFPYPGMTRYEVTSKIQEGYRMPCPDTCPSNLYEIMRKCWQEQPTARYTPEDLNKALSKYHERLLTAKDEWEVKESDVKPVEKIGESIIGEEFWGGQFSQKSVLVKYHSPNQPLGLLVHEAEALQTLSHPHVIGFLGICPKGMTIFIVMEPVEVCNLLQYLRTLKFSLNHSRVLEMALHVASGMAYLHKQGIIHRNLSASNVMIGDDGKCKIANFQHALLHKQGGVSLSSKKLDGNVRWMAVEVLSNNQYSTMADVWSYGIFLYELSTQGQTPYPGLTDGLVCYKVPEGYCMSAPPGCPVGLYDIMASCWKESTRHRPTSNEIQSRIEDLITQDKKWETSENQVEKKQTLVHKGIYGDIWRCQWKQTEVLVKYYKPGSCSPEVFLWEAEIMKTLEHPNIVKLHAVCTQSPNPFIVLEPMDEVLFTVLREKSTVLELSQMLSMAAQVARGMAYLQEQKVIHRDLTTRSILVKERRTCKVYSFKGAIIDGRDLTPAQLDSKLPIKWTPPESALSKSFSLKSDVWSFGVLLYEVFTHAAIPYSNTKDVMTLFNKLKSGYRLPCPTCPQNIYRLMLECWNNDPEKRPTFDAISEKLESIQDDLKWGIDPSEVKVVKEIGTGRFGQVWEGECKEMTVAVKYHRPQTNIADEFLWEAELLKTLDHPHVVKLIGFNATSEKVFTVMSYMKHGTLLVYLKSCGRSQTLKTLMSMGAQIADGMAYLQTQSIIHRDLAARSVLVGEDNHCVISDFSEAICTTRTDNPDHQGRDFPIKWLPPEAIVDKVFDTHTDIWSYGILLHEIITIGDVPYQKMSQRETLKKVQEGYRMPMAHGCPEDAYSVMTACWREVPSTRPTFETVHLQMQRICETCKDVPIARSRTMVARDMKQVEERRRSRTTVGSDLWEIDRSSVTLGSKHEEGRFGEVWKGYLSGSELVAIKIPKLAHTTAAEFLHESEIMKMLKYPNIVSLKGLCTSGEPILIITEFMPHGNLVKYLRSSAGRRTALQQLLTWAIQICGGMIHLEQCRIIHRDVAARNILLGDQLVCKISDFGLAQKVSGDTYKESSRTQFPLKWMAPEAIRHRLFSVKSDVWAFGILLHEMVTNGAIPYPGVQNRDVAQLVRAGYRMPCPRGCPKWLHDIMDSCWKEQPEERPTFSDVNTALNLLRNK